MPLPLVTCALGIGEPSFRREQPGRTPLQEDDDCDQDQNLRPHRFESRFEEFVQATQTHSGPDGSRQLADATRVSPATALVAAWLDTPPPTAAKANSTLRLIAYDCSGNVAYDHTFKQALTGITDTAVDAYLNPKGRA